MVADAQIPIGRVAAAARPRPELLEVDFDQKPFTVAWELTRSCALACVHCRATAQPRRDPGELTTQEAYRVVDQLTDLAPSVLVLTGGDPFMRPDLFAIAEYAIRRGLSVSVSPTTTALVTRERLAQLQDLGVQMIHVSLDGASAASHDSFRGFAGTFDRARQILGDLADLGFPTQVGTTVTRRNLDDLPLMVPLLATFGIRMWSLFFLVPTGRARHEDMVDAATAERLWEWMADLVPQVPFSIRTTAAPQYRRTLLRRAPRHPSTPQRLTGAGYQITNGPSGVQTRGVNDGKGFLFIDHLGEICPSGFLQLSAGNVRLDHVGEVYRSSALFRSLRDPSALQGRCGRCRYADLCGGSRARAYGVSGSCLDEDPLCGLSETEIAL